MLRTSFGCRLGALIVTIFLLSGLSHSLAWPLQQKTRTNAPRLFAYKPIAFDLKEESVKDRNGVIIKDVNYAAYTSERGRIKAYIVGPAGKTRCAGVLFFHWLGEEKSNRDEFLEEAVALARHGTISLLIQGYFPWAVAPKDGDTDRQRIIDETIEVRRALDLLISQPQVDRRRVGYVGHDYGAMYGAIVSGVEHRVKTYVFMAAMSNFGDWSLKYWPKSGANGEAAYRLATKVVDPINFVPHATPASLLFQFSNNDKYISKELASAYARVASPPKQIVWYDALHDLNIEAARRDRREWLTRRLGLSSKKSAG